MKPLFLLFLSLCALSASAAETVRVLSFNLRYINTGDIGDRKWSARREAAADIIKKDAPDFVGTQEAFREMLDDVRQRVPGYAEIGVGRDDGKTKGEYSAILYREAAWEVKESGTFWLSDTPEAAGSMTWGNKVTRVCTWGKFRHKANGSELYFYNTHLDHQSQPSREKAAAMILRRIAARETKAPVIVTGDFNAAPDNPAIAAMLKGPPALTDAWAALHKDVKPAESGTFHNFSGRRDGSRIDYIFTTAEFTSTEAAILNEAQDGKWPSDHYPVRATLTLKP
jgi:endonuclease/exonuclease/phosphatase family metal-dependent hydrolase